VNPTPDYPKRSSKPNVFAGFLIDPDAKTPNGKLFADAYINGIDGKDAKEIVVTNDKDGGVLTGSSFNYVDVNKNRWVVLYDLGGMHFGFEVKGDPGNSKKADNFHVPDGSIRHLHVVNVNGTDYAVALIR
jgi:hypothetical protein